MRRPILGISHAYKRAWRSWPGASLIGVRGIFPSLDQAALPETPDLAAEISLARWASVSRSRGGEVVTSVLSISCAAAATRSTAKLNASSFTFDGLFIPDNFRTNCSAEACTSSDVAGGSKLKSVFIFRHISFVCHGCACRSRQMNYLGTLKTGLLAPPVEIGT